MTDTNVADAVAYALDDGIKSLSDGAELMNSAGYLNALATHIHGAYIPDGSLPFTTVDTSNNLLDIGPGRAFVTVSGVEVQSDRSGAIDPGYDTTLAADVVVGISLPSEVTDLGLDAGENDVWVAVDADGSNGAAGSVYIRHGSGLSQPADPSVQLGSVDADSGDTTRANDRATPALADAEYPDIAGSPRFSTHTHSEGGLSAVPNAGLANDSITRSAGDGLSYSSGSAGTALGGAATLTVDAALEYIRSNGSTISGQLADLGTNPGTFGALLDAAIDGNSAAGTPHSFTFALDAETLLEVYAESDGAGGVQNLRVTLPELARVGDDIVTVGGTTIWESANGVVPQAQLGGPASSLSAYPLVSADIATDSVTGTEIDLSIAPAWTSTHTFDAGITGLPSPTNATDAARKEYVDAVEQALDIKDSVRAATDGSNVDLASTTDPNPIDGVTLNNGDRVLLKDQTTASENGLYNAQTATDPTTWTRTDDADEDDEITSGLFAFVEEGTANANRGFVLVTADPITVGTTALDFTQFSGAGQIKAGDGLNESGDTLSLNEGYAATWTSQHRFDSGIDTRSTISDGTTTIWNSPGGYVEQSALENDAVTVASGNGVKGGGGVALGGSLTLDVEPADVAGALLVDDGADALAVDETSIDHDNIDQSSVSADDHHPRLQVSDSGAAVVMQPTDVNLASALDVTDDGDGTITVDVAVDPREFNTDESGTVTAGSAGMVYAHGLPDGDTLEVLRAGLLLADGQPAPTDLDLILATLDGTGGGTKQTEVVTGDGTVQATVEGDPVASYENTSGGEETVAVLVDNGNYNAGTGADQDIVADAHGEVL